MWKIILASTLIIQASFVATAAETATIAQPLPVIVKYEKGEQGTCRLYFENGSEQDISCRKIAG